MRTPIVAVVACALLAGCGRAASTTTRPPPRSRPHVTITAYEYRFDLPPRLPAGFVDVTLVNRGKQIHQLQLVKLGSMSPSAFRKVASVDNVAGVKHGTVYVGGPNGAVPGGSATATVHLTPGLYAVTCFIPAPKGGLHSARGMFATVSVVTTTASVADAPPSQSKIELADFSFVLPPGFAGGRPVAITNAGDQIHELNLWRVAPGMTFERAKVAALASAGPAPPGPPPITLITGTTGLSTGQRAWLTMDLAPGRYLLACFFPDPSQHSLPHLLEGMIKEFTVS